MNTIQRSLLLLLTILLVLPFYSNGLSTRDRMKEQTHYDVLGLDQDKCDLRDVKKAYRKLALKYHPDRVPAAEKEEATVKFREVSEAYQVLSDENKRAEYDRSLKYGGTGAGGHGRYQNQGGFDMHDHFGGFGAHRHRDPFAQFDDLFRNDPFFSDAFKDMDDLFSKTFQNKNSKEERSKSWGEWFIDKLGVEVTTSSTTMNSDGTFSTSKKNYGRSSGSSSYTSRSTRTIIDNGRRIKVQSMEKDGNRIEERYEGNTLVSRLVNGRPQNIDRIAGGDL